MENMLGFWGEETLDNAIAKMKEKGTAFSSAYNQHMANYNKVKSNPQLLAKWQTIKNYADKTKATIQAVNNSVDKSVNWLKDVFGMQTSNLNGLSNVGVLPLVPIAYVTAAIAGMTYVIGQIWQFNTEANQYADFVAKGATPQQIIEYKKETKTQGFLGNINDITKWVVIGGALYFAWKKWGDK